MINEYLKQDNLIICPNSIKKNVIQEINALDHLISYKLMDLNEFMENYFFSYDKKTIFYLMKKLNKKYEIILEYLNSFYFLENKKYKNLKLNELNQLKEELFQENLLKTKPLFHSYLMNTNILIYGYDTLDPFYEKIFSNYTNYHHIIKKYTKKNHNVYEFNHIEEEIAYVCHDIKKKLDQQISINKIKIIKPSEEYVAPLHRIFDWCHIPIDLEEKISLYNLEIGKDLLVKIKKHMNFDEIIENYQKEEIDTDILNQIIEILNEYILLDTHSAEVYAMIEYDLKHTFLKEKIKENCVRLCEWEEIDLDDYIYLLGFNKENYLILHKDEDFLSDAMKQELGLLLSNQKNKENMMTLQNHLNQTENLIITYKLRTAFNTYNPSLTIYEENYKIIKNPEISYTISNIFNEISLAKKYDEFYQYGIISEELQTLKNHYPNMKYRTYNNQFQKLDRKEFLSSLKKPFTLSYSTIDEYYHCSFRYYINHILKIKEENTDEFYMNIGNIFHYVLSKCFEPDFVFDDAWNQEANKYSFTFNKLVLLDKLKQELKYDIKIMKEHRKYSYFNEYLYEKRFSIPIPNDKKIEVNLVGIADKISYLTEKEKTLVSVIDYKTGNLSADLNNIVYGIGMQLPIYLYFIKRSNLFSNIEIVGFYLQKIINKDMKAIKGKNIEELKENALKLVGYSLDEEENLEKWDMTYQNSKMISGLKKTQNGFYPYSKILNKTQIENIDTLVSKKIEEATNSILDADFRINPKKIERDTIGCEYCSYRDICFKTEQDEIELKKYRNLEFLGGKDNA